MKIIIETERFILREMLPTDLDGMYELDSDPEVHTYLGNMPATNRNKVIETINFVRQQYQDNGIGRWAIIDKNTNAFVGWCGLKFVTDITNNQKNFYDIGYRLLKKYWGQGIATETSIPALGYAFNTLHLNEVYASAHIDNVGSNKILQKLGLRYIETFYYEDIPCNWYKITNEEYAYKKLKE